MVINTDLPNQQQTIVVVCIASSIVTSVFVAFRIWTRVFIIHSVGSDDCELSRLRFFSNLL